MKKRLFSLILVLTLCLTLALPVLADNTGFVRDGADLLGPREESDLESELGRISREYDTDVFVVTVDSIGGRRGQSYTEDYFDEHFGRDHDGILLLITMQEREYWIIGNGFGAKAMSNSDIDRICDHIEPYLRDANYAEAFQRFAKDCEQQLDGAVNGFPFQFGKMLLISLVVGFVVALVVVLVLAAQLRSARRRNTAEGYASKGSFHLTGAFDIYLYRNVSRRPRQDSSSGGGRGSGGGSRSGGGGKF